MTHNNEEEMAVWREAYMIALRQSVTLQWTSAEDAANWAKEVAARAVLCHRVLFPERI